MDGCVGNVKETTVEEVRKEVHKRFVVPEGYMLDETDFIEGIISGLRNTKGDQCRLDEVYDELVTGLKRGLKVVSCRKRRNGQVWFTKELADMRKVMHRRESEWLQSKTGDNRKYTRSKYLEIRQTYSKVVKRAKRSYQKRMQEKLEEELKCPKKFWKSMKKMNVGNKRKGMGNLLEVYVRI